MIVLNKIQYNNKLFQVLMDNNQNRIILEIKNNNNNYYYMYPDVIDLININKIYYPMSNILYSENEKNNKKSNKLIKISQKVLIAGMATTLIMVAPMNIKSFSLDKYQNLYTTISENLSNKITTHDELNKIIDTKSITKDDVHNAIDKNNNLYKYKDIIHKFVDDIYKINPNQNWWIFYQNINRMNINYDPQKKSAAGTFNLATSEIKILKDIKDKDLDVVLRHELTHALSLIETEINNKKISISFYNDFSGYGRSITELLTATFNSYTNDFPDTAYQEFVNLFSPLITEIGEKEFTDTLFTGDINTFIDICNPYFSNIYEYISYVDAIFYNINGGDIRLEKSIDEEFIKKFSNMSIEFFVNMSYKQLKEGTITYNDYIENRTNYMNSLFNLITYDLEKGYVSFSGGYEILTKLEQNIFDEDTINKLNLAYDNNNNLEFYLSYNNKTQEFKNLIIYLRDKNNTSKEYYKDLHGNNINNFYFIVEDVNGNLKLRLINENNKNYINIDILTYQYIDYQTNIITKVPLIDYINYKKEKILGENWSNDDYCAVANQNFFNLSDIMEFANNNAYINNKTK